MSEIEQLREEIEVLRLIYPEGTADKLNILEKEIKRLRRELEEAESHAYALRCALNAAFEYVRMLPSQLDRELYAVTNHAMMKAGEQDGPPPARS